MAVEDMESTRFDNLTANEQVEIARKGGIASGEARRRKKSMKESMDLLLSLPLKNKKILKKAGNLGLNPNDIDNQMAMVIAQWQEACSGNTTAYNNIQATIGEKPIEEVKQTTNLIVKEKQKNAIDDIFNQMKQINEDDL